MGWGGGGGARSPAASWRSERARALAALLARPCSPPTSLQQQQLQAQHLSHATHGPPVQLPPHPSGLQPPGIPPVTGSSSGLLALGALGSQAHLSVKDEKNHHELDHRGATRGRGAAGVWAEALEALLWADTANAITLGPGVSTPWSHPSVKFLVCGNQSPIPQAHPPQSLKCTHSSLPWKTSGPFILEYLLIFLATSCPLSKGQPQSHSFRRPSWPS